MPREGGLDMPNNEMTVALYYKFRLVMRMASDQYDGDISSAPSC